MPVTEFGDKPPLYIGRTHSYLKQSLLTAPLIKC